MTRYSIFLILFSLLFGSVFSVNAANRSGNIVIEVQFRSDSEIDEARLLGGSSVNGKIEFIYALEGATAILLHNGDTLKYTMTDKDGICLFRNIPYGKYTLEVSHIGYEPFKTEFEHNSSKSNVMAVLSENGLFLEAIRVKGSIPLVIRKGDTLCINPVAVQTKQGAAAIEIIKQVPGVELNEGGGLTIYGETLRRSYVGGSTLFGTGVLTALKNLDADLVKNIKFYDEEEYAGVINGHVEKRKVKVMNIETTRKILSSVTGHVFVGVGKDFKVNSSDDEKIRYKSGLSFNMFSKKVKIDTDAYLNNVGLSSSKADYQNSLLSGRGTGEKRLAAAKVETEYLVRGENVYTDSDVLTIEYSYNFDKNTNRSRETREYYPTINYAWRKYSSEQLNSSLKKMHNAGISYTSMDGKRKFFHWSFTHDMSFDDGKILSYSKMGDISDKLEKLVADTSLLRERNWGISEKVCLSGRRIDINAAISLGQNDGTSLRRVEEIGVEKIFESSPIGKYFSAGCNMRLMLYSFKIKNENTSGNISANVDINYNKDTKKHFRYDIIDSESVFDQANSYSYSTNSWRNSVSLSASVPSSIQWGSSVKRSHYLQFGVTQVLINDTERLFGKKSQKNYYVPEGSLSLWFGDLGISYKLNASVPSLEQLREYVDDTNPLYLRVGNPNLKASYLHTVNLQYNKGYSFSDVSYWNLYLRGSIRQNSVAPYNVYYVESTELPIGGGYKVQPGVTVESYKNVKNEKEVDLAFNYSNRFSAIKTKLTLFANGRYSTRYSYVQDILNETDTYLAQLMLETYTSYRWMNLKLRSSTGYTFSENSAKNNYEYFNQYLQATLEATIFKVWNIGAGYNLIFNKPLGNVQSVLNRNNILNVTTGVTLFKGRLTAGISVFDIFDSSTDFTTMLYSEYIQNNWTATFGRYISFDVVFNLRKNRFKE